MSVCRFEFIIILLLPYDRKFIVSHVYSHSHTLPECPTYNTQTLRLIDCLSVNLYLISLRVFNNVMFVIFFNKECYIYDRIG